MHHAILYVDPTGPSPVGFAQAAGLPGDLRVDFKTQAGIAYPNIAAEHPQLVLRPFSRPDIHAYDIVIDDPVGGSGLATVPGVVMNDRFSVEIYTRNDIGQPQRMIGVGRVDLTGYGYMRTGPLGPASFPTGPEGPAGPAGIMGPLGPEGPEGLRGSRWYTGAGPPVTVPDARVPGDMYLNTTNGDVWRWDGGALAWTRFTGTG